MVSIALLTAAFHAQWQVFWAVGSSFLLTYGTRMFSAYLITKIESDELRLATVTDTQ